MTDDLQDAPVSRGCSRARAGRRLRVFEGASLKAEAALETRIAHRRQPETKMLVAHSLPAAPPRLSLWSLGVNRAIAARRVGRRERARLSRDHRRHRQSNMPAIQTLPWSGRRANSPCGRVGAVQCGAVQYGVLLVAGRKRLRQPRLRRPLLLPAGGGGMQQTSPPATFSLSHLIYLGHCLCLASWKQNNTIDLRPLAHFGYHQAFRLLGRHPLESLF